MKKIVFFTGKMNRGGASKVVSVLANHFAQRNNDVSIISFGTVNKQYLLENSIKVVSHPVKKKFGQFEKIHFMRNFIKENNIEVVISFLLEINISAVIACAGLKCKLIISERNDPKYSVSSFRFILSKILYPFADVVVFQSKKVRNYYKLVASKRSKVILNPVEITCSASLNKSKKISTSGRLTSQKNHKLLINAFKQVHDKYPEFELYIYGDGELHGVLNDQIKTLDLTDNVHLVGNVLDIHEKIADSMIFVISSDYEGLSNSLLEAMAMGLPCISTYSGAAEEVITDGVDGFLVSVKDKNELVNAMLKLIESKELQDIFMKNAKKKSNLFMKNNVISQWEEIVISK